MTSDDQREAEFPSRLRQQGKAAPEPDFEDQRADRRGPCR